MLIFGLVIGALAAALHVYIFVLESITWESERTRATFRSGTVEEARVQKFLAFNQGFYNLFLALMVAAGIIAITAGASTVGFTLAFAGLGTMLAAALVLGIASRRHMKAACTQGVLPLAAILVLAIHLLA